MRNSLGTTQMPTASTSIINGNYESNEPPYTNYYTKKTLSINEPYPNKHLIRDLKKADQWTEEIAKLIVAAKGEIQNIYKISPEIRLTGQGK